MPDPLVQPQLTRDRASAFAFGRLAGALFK
jgi:hypothetical protein